MESDGSVLKGFGQTKVLVDGDWDLIFESTTLDVSCRE